MGTQKDAKWKRDFLENMLETSGDLAASLKNAKLPIRDYNRLLENAPAFRAEVDAFEEIREALIESMFMQKVKEGDVRAVIEARRMQAVRKSSLDFDKLKQDVMIYLVSTAKNKSQAIRNFSRWFKVSESTGGKFLDGIVIEKDLELPADRDDRLAAENQSSLKARFDRGELSEIEMYKELLSVQLDIIQRATFPSEKSRATEQCRQLGVRMEELKRQAQINAQRSNYEICTQMDSMLMGISPERVIQLELEYNGKSLEAKAELVE
jgi:hypothetical protein